MEIFIAGESANREEIKIPQLAWKEKKTAYKFEIYKDKSEEYRFRFRAPNGEVMFQGQGYKQNNWVVDEPGPSTIGIELEW